MRNVVSLVLGGGRGTRLHPLTKYRAKPAVPLGGKYRLIDIPLSNCINSGLNHVYVLTQFMSVSLHRHIRQTYRFDAFSGGFVEVLAAQQTSDAGTDWFQGTADAVRKNLRYIEQPGIEYVLILSGDQLYRMDFREMIASHETAKADVTIAALPVAREDAQSLGIMRIDDDGRINGFVEKPKTNEELDSVKTDPAWIESKGVSCEGRECLASMGIYLFNRDFLVDVLKKTTYEDFGKEVFPAAFRAKHVQAHLFDGYWEDIGTIKAFYEANLALVGEEPPFRLNVPDAPIYSRARFLPPTMIENATVNRSLIADGCRIGKGAVIENSIIGLRTHIGDGVVIRDSIVMGADYYSADGEGAAPPLEIGAGSEIRGAILDKNCSIGKDVRVVNTSGIAESEDSDTFVIRDGIPIVTKDAVLPDGWRPS